VTKQLSDLFEQFSTLESSKQLEKIREIRHHRSIERPAAAVKRVKKEKKQSEKKKTNLADLLKKLPPEQRAALVSRLKADLDEKKVNEASGGAPRVEQQNSGNENPRISGPASASDAGSSGEGSGS